MKGNKLKLLTYGFIGYVLFAIIWWGLLLWKKNENIKELQLTNISLLKTIHPELDDFTLKQNIEKDLNQQKTMILSEGILLSLVLLGFITLYFIESKKQIAYAQQEKNFLLSVTHELKSPITSIQLTLETFIKHTLPFEKIQQLSINVLPEVERLNQLVNNILYASRMQGNIKYEKSLVNIDDLIFEISNNLEIKFPNHTIEYIPKDIPFHCDKNGIYSVIQNIVENALKYSPIDTKVLISTNMDNKHLHISVKDNGIGIPSNERKKVFHKFYRIGNEETRTSQGTGLGLYIVKKIILAHQGDIQIKNNTPTGTIFEIKLPIL